MFIVLRIGVLSDTHLKKVTGDFRYTLTKVLGHVDMLIHAGDMVSIDVYDYLSNWELKAVRGNMDDFDLQAILPEKRIETLNGKRIGIIHGRGSPYGLEDLVAGEFENVDAIVFGHSHMPLRVTKKGVMLFNPGSCRGSQNSIGTVGIIEIADEITFRHIEIK